MKEITQSIVVLVITMIAVGFGIYISYVVLPFTIFIIEIIIMALMGVFITFTIVFPRGDNEANEELKRRKANPCLPKGFDEKPSNNEVKP